MNVIPLAVSMASVWGDVGRDGEGLTPFTCSSSGCPAEALDSNLADSTSFLQATSSPFRRTNNTPGYDPVTLGRQHGAARLAQVKSVVGGGEMYYLDENGGPYFFHATAHLWAVCAMQEQGIKNVGGGVNGRGFYVAPRPTNYVKAMAARSAGSPLKDQHLYMVKLKADKFWEMGGLYGHWVDKGSKDVQCDSEQPGCDYSAVTWDGLAQHFEKPMTRSEDKVLNPLVGVTLNMMGRTDGACRASGPVAQDGECVWPPSGFPTLMDNEDKKVESGDITLTFSQPSKCIMTMRDGSVLPIYTLNAYHKNFVYATMKTNVMSNADAETGCKQVDDYAAEHGWKGAYLASIEEITFKSPYNGAPTLIEGLEITDVFTMIITKTGKGPSSSG